MSASPSVYFLVLIGVPVATALGSVYARTQRTARAAALAGSAVAGLLACGLAGHYYLSDPTGPLLAQLALGGSANLHFALDGLNAPLLALVSLLTLAIVAGAPALLLTRSKLRALLWLEALSLLTLTTADLLVLVLSFGLVLVPVYQFGAHAEDARPLTRIFRRYHLTGFACLVTATALLAYYTRPRGLSDLNVLALDVQSVPEHARTLIFWLFAAAALLRMGIVPLHSWLPASLERVSLLAVALLASLRSGFYLLARVAVPAFPEAAHAAMPTLAALALVSAVYGALAALGQRDLRRMVGFLIASQSGVMLTGLAFGDPQAMSGTLLYWLGFATATTGLVLMTAAVVARTGHADMRKLGGLVLHAPNLSGFFFLFALSTIAIPGTLAFVAEDMLIHAALSRHPLLTVVMILSMTLNAITALRAFFVAFLGPARADDACDPVADLLPRERITALCVVAALLLGGLVPQVLIDAQASAARHIAFSEGAPSSHPHRH